MTRTFFIKAFALLCVVHVHSARVHASRVRAPEGSLASSQEVKHVAPLPEETEPEIPPLDRTPDIYVAGPPSKTLVEEEVVFHEDSSHEAKDLAPVLEETEPEFPPADRTPDIYVAGPPSKTLVEEEVVFHEDSSHEAKDLAPVVEETEPEFPPAGRTPDVYVAGPSSKTLVEDAVVINEEEYDIPEYIGPTGTDLWETPVDTVVFRPVNVSGPRMFEEPVDDGTREVDPKSVVLSKKLPGCEKARKLLLGKTATEGDIIVWDCLRCSQGYLEKLDEMEVPALPGLPGKKAARGYFRQSCEWRPCGDLCKTCEKAKKKFAFFRSTTLRCTECESTYGNAVLVDTHLDAKHDGDEVEVKRVCSALATLKQDDMTESSKEVALKLTSMLQLQDEEIRIPSLLQMAVGFVHLASAEFVSTGDKDMVAHGTKFMDDVVKAAVDEVSAYHLVKIGKTLSESRLIADTRGALELCVSVAMNRIGDGSPVVDTMVQHVVKRCDSADNALYRLMHAVCAKLPSCKEGTTTDFVAGVKEAPRRALDVLNMFGAQADYSCNLEAMSRMEDSDLAIDYLLPTGRFNAALNSWTDAEAPQFFDCLYQRFFTDADMSEKARVANFEAAVQGYQDRLSPNMQTLMLSSAANLRNTYEAQLHRQEVTA